MASKVRGTTNGSPFSRKVSPRKLQLSGFASSSDAVDAHGVVPGANPKFRFDPPDELSAAPLAVIWKGLPLPGTAGSMLSDRVAAAEAPVGTATRTEAIVATRAITEILARRCLRDELFIGVSS